MDGASAQFLGMPGIDVWVFVGLCLFAPITALIAAVAGTAGGLILLANAYLFALLTWQGDKYGIWYDPLEETT